jgi:hypothetical protein
MNVRISPSGWIFFNGLHFRVRQCYGNDMWSLLFYGDGKWQSVCVICSECTPMKWISMFISSNANSVIEFRDIILNKRILQ